MAQENGLVQMKGHSTNPGLRLSMYNGMELDGVKKLIEFMVIFQEKYDESYQSNCSFSADDSTRTFSGQSI